MLPTDAQMELFALREISELCQACQKSLSARGGQGSDLQRVLAQIELRALYVIRHYPLLGQDQSSLESRQKALQQLLAGQRPSHFSG